MSIDADVRARLAQGDGDGAASLAIRTLGPELHGYLCAIARDDGLAADAFSIACEQLWRNLHGFRWEAALRTWFYQLGRHALHHLREHGSRRRERNLPLSLAPEVEAAQRSVTAPHQRTDVKAGLQALRASLGPDDHELLILRLDRRMAWKDIALLLEGDGGGEQRVATLRKRFERVKDRLRTLARERGLLDHD